MCRGPDVKHILEHPPAHLSVIQLLKTTPTPTTPQDYSLPLPHMRLERIMSYEDCHFYFPPCLKWCKDCLVWNIYVNVSSVFMAV